MSPASPVSQSSSTILCPRWNKFSLRSQARFMRRRVTQRQEPVLRLNSFLSNPTLWCAFWAALLGIAVAGSQSACSESSASSFAWKRGWRPVRDSLYPICSSIIASATYLTSFVLSLVVETAVAGFSKSLRKSHLDCSHRLVAALFFIIFVWLVLK